MPYREIHDDEDGVWVVFSTQPRSGANVRPEYADGWLSFHRGTERRRLAPIPPGWDEAPDDQVRTWLRDAALVARTDEDDESERAQSRGAAPDTRETADAGPRTEAPATRGSADAEPLPPVTESAPAGKGMTSPAARVQKSIERIRAMLSDIRSDR
jgi:hypothetical protein